MAGTPVSSAGDAAVVGLNISKLITSIFGGMVVTNNPAIASRLRTWRRQRCRRPGFGKSLRRLAYLFAAMTAFSRFGYAVTWWLQHRTRFLRGLTDAYHLDGQIRFPPDAFDAMLPLEARVGLAQLRRYEGILQGRRFLAEFWRELLDRHFPEWQAFPQREGATYSHIVARVPSREAVVNRFAAAGIELGILIQYSIADLAGYGQSLGPASAALRRNAAGILSIFRRGNPRAVAAAVASCVDHRRKGQKSCFDGCHHASVPQWRYQFE